LLSPHESTIALISVVGKKSADEVEETGIYDEIHAVYVQKCIVAENGLVERVSRLKRAHLERVSRLFFLIVVGGIQERKR
jgi:hypothetical protein